MAGRGNPLEKSPEARGVSGSDEGKVEFSKLSTTYDGFKDSYHETKRGKHDEMGQSSKQLTEEASDASEGEEDYLVGLYTKIRYNPVLLFNIGKYGIEYRKTVEDYKGEIEDGRGILKFYTRKTASSLPKDVKKIKNTIAMVNDLLKNENYKDKWKNLQGILSRLEELIKEAERLEDGIKAWRDKKHQEDKI